MASFLLNPYVVNTVFDKHKIEDTSKFTYTQQEQKWKNLLADTTHFSHDGTRAVYIKNRGFRCHFLHEGLLYSCFSLDEPTEEVNRFFIDRLETFGESTGALQTIQVPRNSPNILWNIA